MALEDDTFRELDDNEDQYQREACIERFRRQNPTWTEEEIQNYLCQSDPE